MRVAVFTDHIFWREGEALYSDRVFPLFVARLATLVERLVFVARLNPHEGSSHYRLPAGTQIEPLPWTDSLASARTLLPLTLRSMRRFWRTLDRVDTVWLVGSYLMSLVFAVLAAARQARRARHPSDLPSYARGRHPSDA